MKRIIYCSVFFLLGADIFAQQDPQFSQYMFNPYTLNAAYFNQHLGVSFGVLNRFQWVGFEGAPKTQALTVYTSEKEGKLSYGLKLVNDKIGARSTINASVSCAYKLLINQKHRLSFALRGGILNYNANADDITYENSNDPHKVGALGSITKPDGDFALFYNSGRLYAGFSSNHLFAKGATTSSTGHLNVSRHTFITSGYVFRLNETFSILPSIMLKHVANAPASLDINANLLVKEYLSFGVSARSENGLIFLFKIDLKNNLSIGYAFDSPLGNPIAQQQTAGSHEFYLGYNLISKKYKTITPRYL